MFELTNEWLTWCFISGCWWSAMVNLWIMVQDEL